MDPRTLERADLYRSIGARIGAARQSARLTLEELATRAGLCMTTCWKAEQGKSGPDVFTIYKIAGALGVAPSDLLP